MSVTNFRRASLKNGLPKSSDFADIAPAPAVSAFMVATGGVTSSISDGGFNYKVHTFTSSVDFIVTNLGDGLIDYMIVGGGGGGGDALGGGGGAGGLLTSSLAVVNNEPVLTWATTFKANDAVVANDADVACCAVEA